MNFEHNKDPFKDKQPPIEFLDDLHGPVHTKLPANWNCEDTEGTQVFISAALIWADFPDPQKVLDTAYEDFAAFLNLAVKAEVVAERNSAHVDTKGCFCFRTALDASLPEEAYRITVTKEQCLVESADTEGIRRAIFYLEDEMYRREGNFLPLGEIYRYAVIKTRISRGFLNPHYGLDVDGELSDDTEYYSDNYLNRLAHAGINSLWTQEHFRVMLPSKVIPEYGWDSEARIARLNRLVSRCKKYGIKVYLEGVEPASTYANEHLWKHPEILGQHSGGLRAFCASTKAGKAYIRESFRKLFELVPDLAGMVNITVGESESNCASTWESKVVNCPHCKALGLNRPQILADVEVQMLEAMRSVKPDAELISWAYAIRGWDAEEREEYFRLRDPRVTSLINFEDHGKVNQLGKIRTAMDYWLSYVGPGQVFEQAAEVASQRNTPLFAKIQVCSSHEVSTVPYIPVPGLLYDKFKYMHENHVSGAMYCWYFGNYPCMMNKAASELAFGPFPADKEAFLEHIAGIYWGRQKKKAAEAYLQFEKGYSQYPVSLTFEWHGPMGDAPVWPLHLEPVDLPVSKAYTNEYIPGGDRIGEVILQGHTHEEMITLCEGMSRDWREGAALLAKLENHGDHIKEDQQYVAGALDILFASGTNILRFYELRNRLGLCKMTEGQNACKEADTLLDEMRNIVMAEMEHSRQLIALCEKDKRLGYHSEAIAFKYFPDKLRWRISCLEQLLAEEFQAVENRIAEGKTPLPFFRGLEAGAHRYVTTAEQIEDAEWESFMYQDGSADESVRIRLCEDSQEYCMQILSESDEMIVIKPEFRMFHPYAPMKLNAGMKPEFSAGSYGLYGEDIKRELNKWRIEETQSGKAHLWTIRLSKEDFFAGQSIPFRLAVMKKGKQESEWEKGKTYYERLIFGVYSPDSYVFIIPREYAESV